MPLSFIYRFGGRRLVSSFPLIDLENCNKQQGASSDLPINIELSRDTAIPSKLMSQESFLWNDSNSILSVYKLDRVFVVDFPNLARFSVNPYTSEIVINSHTDETTLSHLLLDQVLPRLLAFSGEIILHGGAVVLHDIGAIAFLGESGHGKSSMTTSFVQNGAELLSDDAVKLDIKSEPPSLSGLYPSLRLWPNALDGLNVKSAETSDMAHYSTKRRVSTPSSPAKTLTHSLNTVFLLQMGENDSDIQLLPFSDRDLMLTLIEGSFRLDPTDKIRGQAFFKQIDDAKSRIKGYSLIYPRGYEYLPTVYTAVVSHLRENA